jgi:membrane protein implicated in regulation of membrane protease activity
MALSETKSLPELIGGLASDISGLFRKEIELAKTEVSEKVSQASHALAFVAAGAVLALGALGVILSAIVTALAAVFVGAGMGATAANSVAAAIVGIVVAVVAWLQISRGLNGLKVSNLKLDRTSASLQRDASVVKERL